MKTLSLKFTTVGGSTVFSLLSDLFSDFVFGTVLNQTQKRMSKLKSDSVRIFVALWLCSILIITVG